VARATSRSLSPSPSSSATAADDDSDDLFHPKSVWSFLRHLSKVLLVPFLQGVALGLGQHGTHYLVAHLFSRQQQRSIEAPPPPPPPSTSTAPAQTQTSAR